MSSFFRACELYCNRCNWKLIADSTEKMTGLFEIKTSELQGHLPRLNPETKKIETFKSFPQKKKFRCPNCGFGVTPRIVKDVQKEIDFKTEQKQKEAEFQKLQDFISDHSRRKKDENRADGCETSTEGPPV